jgi:hypothetical protein
MDIVIWSYIFGGATIFALIVGIFSVWNGRMTRRELTEVIERTSRQTQEIIEATSQRTQEILIRIDNTMTKISDNIAKVDEHITEMERRHTSLLEHILTKT